MVRGGRLDVLISLWFTDAVEGSEFVEAACENVRCSGRLVLDGLRVRQLAERTGIGRPIRWWPDPTSVERGEEIRRSVESFDDDDVVDGVVVGDVGVRKARSAPALTPLRHVRRSRVRA